MKICLLAIVLMCPIILYSQDKATLRKIEQIKLLSDTREDILRIFGEPSKNKESLIWDYEVDSGEINVSFTRGECFTTIDNPNTTQGWKIPAWTVEDVTYTPLPRKRFDIKKLRFDLTKFTATPVQNSPNGKAMEYENGDYGIYYFVNSKHKVEYITYFPKKSQMHLRCDQSK